mmetsp:Transcript_63838/g.177085  ORF Transcript_63838/g.177085 Transcript_63838/m.177085 type:complete len:455 (-) Transcript_63838:513-1877(-)
MQEPAPVEARDSVVAPERASQSPPLRQAPSQCPRCSIPGGTCSGPPAPPTKVLVWSKRLGVDLDRCSEPPSQLSSCPSTLSLLSSTCRKEFFTEHLNWKTAWPGASGSKQVLGLSATAARTVHLGRGAVWPASQCGAASATPSSVTGNPAGANLATAYFGGAGAVGGGGATCGHAVGAGVAGPGNMMPGPASTAGVTMSTQGPAPHGYGAPATMASSDHTMTGITVGGCSAQKGAFALGGPNSGGRPGALPWQTVPPRPSQPLAGTAGTWERASPAPTQSSSDAGLVGSSTSISTGLQPRLKQLWASSHGGRTDSCQTATPPCNDGVRGRAEAPSESSPGGAGADPPAPSPAARARQQRRTSSQLRSRPGWWIPRAPEQTRDRVWISGGRSLAMCCAMPPARARTTGALDSWGAAEKPFSRCSKDVGSRASPRLSTSLPMAAKSSPAPATCAVA